MPARGNIAAADGETTPVTHTFVPDGDVGPGNARYINRNAAVPTASEFVLVRLSKSNSKQSVIQTPGAQVNPDIVEVKLKYPSTYTDAVSGLTLVDFVDEVIVKRMTHPRSSYQRRVNSRALIRNILGHSQVLQVWDNNESIW